MRPYPRGMLMTAPQSPIAFPYPEIPRAGQVIELAPGILWARFALRSA